MNPIEQLIDHLRDGDFAAAGPVFNELMAIKIDDALNAEQIKVASEIYGEPLENDEDVLDDEEFEEDEDEDYDEEDEE